MRHLISFIAIFILGTAGLFAQAQVVESVIRFRMEQNGSNAQPATQPTSRPVNPIEKWMDAQDAVMKKLVKEHPRTVGRLVRNVHIHIEDNRDVPQSVSTYEYKVGGGFVRLDLNIGAETGEPKFIPEGELFAALNKEFDFMYPGERARLIQQGVEKADPALAPSMALDPANPLQRKISAVESKISTREAALVTQEGRIANAQKTYDDAEASLYVKYGMGSDRPNMDKYRSELKKLATAKDSEIKAATDAKLAVQKELVGLRTELANLKAQIPAAPASQPAAAANTVTGNMEIAALTAQFSCPVE